MTNVHAGPTGGKADSKTPPVSDVYNFDEDSSDALSLQQPKSQQSPCSTLASPPESGGAEAAYSTSNLNTPTQVRPYVESILWEIIK